MDEKSIKVGSGTLIERTYDSGKKAYQVRIRRSGVKVSKTFGAKKEAIDYITVTDSKIIKGESVTHEKTKKILLSTIFREYIAANKLTLHKEQRIGRLIEEIGDVPLSHFKSKSFGVYLKTKLQQEIPEQARKVVSHKLFDGGMVLNESGMLVRRTYAPATIRHYYYCIRNALHWHSKVNDYHFDQKPFIDNPPPQAWATPRQRRLEEGELERLIAACDKMYVNQAQLKCLILFLAFSAFRIGETLKIKFSDIRIDSENPSASYIFIPKENQKIKNKKNGYDRYANIRRELYDLIVNRIFQWKEKDTDLVFPFWKNGGQFYSRLRVICKNAGIEDFSTHSFRHSGLAWFFENTSLTDIEISKISGHIELDTLKRYANLRPHKVGAKLWAELPK